MAENNLKRTILVAILVSHAKDGMQARELYAEYLKREGEPLMPNQTAADEFLLSLVNADAVREVNGVYFANSNNSKHVIKLVEEEQDTKNKNKRIFNNFNAALRGRYFNHNQSSFSRVCPNRRKSVCYEQPYIDVPKPQPVAAGRIQQRRMTLGVSSQFRPDTPPRSRSRSNSPGKKDTFGRSDIQNEKRLHSPVLHTKRPRDRSPGSPVAKRSRWSRSPARDRRRSRPRSRSRSPQRDPRRRAVSRSRSPIESRHKRHSPIRERTNVNRPVHENTPPVRSVHENQGASQRATIKRLNGIDAEAGPRSNVRNFKFNLIGDGLLYNVVQGLDETVVLNRYLISHDLLLREAIESVKAIIVPKVNKKKCIILSIGTTDLRNGTSLSDMRKQFVTLYRLCQNNGLKPMVTTISCMDTKELNAKAKIFNEFLRTNFTNVFDLFRSVNGADGGLAQSLASLGKGTKSGKNRATLSIGMHSRLVLRVEV